MIRACFEALGCGLSRLRCRRCGKDMLVAHSCNGRGILLAADARLFGAVVELFARVVHGCYLGRSRAAGIEGAKTGALSFH